MDREAYSWREEGGQSARTTPEGAREPISLLVERTGPRAGGSRHWYGVDGVGACGRDHCPRNRHRRRDQLSPAPFCSYQRIMAEQYSLPLDAESVLADSEDIDTAEAVAAHMTVLHRWRMRKRAARS